MESDIIEPVAYGEDIGGKIISVSLEPTRHCTVPLYRRGEEARKFRLGDRVTKTKGSAWTGRVVGFYATSLTPIGYCVESENEPGSVQIYPEDALAAAEAGRTALDKEAR